MTVGLRIDPALPLSPPFMSKSLKNAFAKAWKHGALGTVLIVCGWLASANGATFNLSPSTISNTYSGVLTLQVTGLTNGEQVQVQHFLDLNSNGVVEATEPLIDTFRIKDGNAFTINGITNNNVPFDRDSTTGSITTTFSLSAPLDKVVGQHIIRLSSPAGNFPPQTNLLVITNAALAQSVSGTIFDGGGAPLPNAVAVALVQPDGGLGAAVVADSNGHYNFNLTPGSYGVFPVLPNYFTDQSIAAQVTLTNGSSNSANLFLTNGSFANTLSGQITDATNGNTLGGVFLQIQSGNLFAVAFTDTNGSYSAALTPSFWRVRPEADGLARRAYVTSQNRLQVDLTTGNVASVNFALPKANAMFFGRFTDNSNVPFVNIKFFGNDQSDFKASGYSNTNGAYAVAVLADGSEWTASPSVSDNPVLTGYLISDGLGSTNISPGQALHQDFVAIRATAQISGQVRDNLGSPVDGVNVFGNVNIGGVQYNSSADTDNSGHYVLPAANGTWFLGVNCCGNDGLEGHGLYDPLEGQGRAVNVPPTNAVLDITVYQIGTPVLTELFRASPSQFSFNLHGSMGANYTIQASTNLSISNWFNLFTLNLTSNPTYLQDNQATNKVRFYRALKN